jgi:hypothetical protein
MMLSAVSEEFYVFLEVEIEIEQAFLVSRLKLERIQQKLLLTGLLMNLNPERRCLYRMFILD